MNQLSCMWSINLTPQSNLIVSFLGDCSTFFNISDDGVIKTIKQLSRDEGEIKDKSGVCSFPVKVWLLLAVFVLIVRQYSGKF